MPIVVPDELRQEIVTSEAAFLRDVPRWNPDRSIDTLIQNNDAAYVFIEPFLKPQSRVLELGSGNGFGLCHVLSRGVDVVGVEPGSTPSFVGRYDRAIRMLKANGFPAERVVEAFGEDLPFPDHVFDIVFSIAVLEHVADVGQVLREAIRVTRPGGVVVMNAPNHWSWYEAHYDITWIPPLLWLRPLAKWFVRSHGRSDYYVDELQTLTPWSVAAVLRPLGVRFRLYPYLLRPADKVSALGFYLSEGNTRRHPIVRRLKPVAGPLAFATHAASWMGVAIGLSAVFNVVIDV